MKGKKMNHRDAQTQRDRRIFTFARIKHRVKSRSIRVHSQSEGQQNPHLLHTFEIQSKTYD